jgi:hypothetical protein
MTFTKPRQLIGAALVAALVVYVGARLGYGGLPPLPTLAGASLLLIALVDVALAVTMRPRIKRKPGHEPVDAMTAARSVALAKASSMAGAIMGGVWLGLLAYLLPVQSLFVAAQSDTTATIIGLISAAALIAAGLWLEHVLRSPDEPEEPYDDEDE